MGAPVLLGGCDKIKELTGDKSSSSKVELPIPEPLLAKGAEALAGELKKLKPTL